MGARGPAATPTATLALRGSWRAGTRSNEPLPERSAEIPKAPTTLSKTARAIWKSLAPILFNSGILTAADLPLLTRYCILSAHFQSLQDYLEEIGPDGKPNGIVGPDGQIRRAAAQLSKLSDGLLAMERQMGMTPASRPNIEAVTGNEPTKSEFF